ncbi:MAG: peptide ABC transporter permease [Myxococcales bacterium]|nr:peptide ABC transporter permease [Myxococcales bacterium]
MLDLRWLARSPTALFGALVLTAVLVCALFGPLLAPYARSDRDVTQQLQGPTATHPFGTDENGADMVTEVIHGARVAVLVGLGSVCVSLLVGVSLGALSGYLGGWVDEVIMRVIEMLLAFPGILLAILIIFITQEPSLLTVIFALSLTGWTGYARLVRGQVLVERERDYVEAARALGLPTPTILARHILPNVLGPVIVQATFGIAGAILAEASLSFLGLGPQNTASWGALLNQGANYFLIAQHMALVPGVAIMLTVLSINFIGDALRDHLDPRLATQPQS